MNITLSASNKKTTIQEGSSQEDINQNTDSIVQDIVRLVNALKAYKIDLTADVVNLLPLGSFTEGASGTFLAGAGTTTPSVYRAVTDADLSLSAITTNNVSTTKHGFAPTLPNDATKFLDGTGNYSSPGIGIFLSTTHLTGNQFAALNTTPFTLVTGIASTLLIPISFRLVSNKTGGAWTNGNTGFYLAYESNKTVNLCTTAVLGLGNGGTVNAFSYQPISITNTAGLTLSGKGLQLVTQADITSGSGGTTAINVEVIYITENPALF